MAVPRRNRISAMGLFDRSAQVDIVAVSGGVRVAIQPQPNAPLLLFEGIGIIFFAGITVHQWPHLSWLTRVFFVWGDIAGIIAWLYQLSGTEEIEFDAQNLTICKNTLGWERRRQYPTASCSELEWWPQSNESHRYALRCKVGWRTIAFADYVSESQACEILAALQRNLPQVAQTMGAMPGAGKSHFTTLGLS
jgi:ethanolamine utilization protein EutA (predicted chaperonin)